MSTLLLIPWIILGYRHPSWKFLGLCQTRKSLLILLVIEIVYWSVLVFLLEKPDPTVVGSGSFAWKYILYYEKGIIPLSWLAEKINPVLGDRIEAHYKTLYLAAALIMDYIFLFILSPRIPQIFSRKKSSSEKPLNLGS